MTEKELAECDRNEKYLDDFFRSSGAPQILYAICDALANEDYGNFMPSVVIEAAENILEEFIRLARKYKGEQ